MYARSFGVNKMSKEIIRWQDIGGGCQRAKVKNGWLVRMAECGSLHGTHDNAYGYGGLTFIPDPKHEWGK